MKETDMKLTLFSLILTFVTAATAANNQVRFSQSQALLDVFDSYDMYVEASGAFRYEDHGQDINPDLRRDGQCKTSSAQELKDEVLEIINTLQGETHFGGDDLLPQETERKAIKDLNNIVRMNHQFSVCQYTYSPTYYYVQVKVFHDLTSGEFFHFEYASED